MTGVRPKLNDLAAIEPSADRSGCRKEMAPQPVGIAYNAAENGRPRSVVAAGRFEAL
jgi:hypothetical protein